MARARTTKGLAKRIALDYFQRPHWLRTLRTGLAWGCAMIAAIVGIGIVAGPAGQAVVPGPVSRAHAFIERDCARCHADDDNSRDRKCSVCHEGAIHQAKQEFTPHCAECHRGHAGRTAPEVLDAACVRCHGKTAIGFGEGEHPEFARLREGAQDEARMRLNHAAHLVAGLRGPEGPVTLQCDSCHRPDAAGRLMLPVTYEERCASCHPLAFDSTGLFPEGTVAPHVKPGIVRAFLVNLYRGEISRRPELLDEPVPARRSAPGDAEPSRFDSWPARTGGEWTAREAAVAEEILVRKDCRLCHRVEETGAGREADFKGEADIKGEAGVEILPTAVPRSWLTGARFDHRGHRLLACTACHDRAPSSRETADVLLPGIAACRSCHRPETGPDPGSGTACVLCHAYHDRARERGLDGPLGLTLEAAGPGEAPGAEPGAVP